MRRRSVSLSVTLAIALAACAENPTGASVDTGSEFQLRAGESVAVEGADLGLRFDLVASDSRCPADAVCITLGDAEAVFTAAEAGRAPTSLTLHTATRDGQRATVGAWTLTLIRLDPYPSSGRPISPGDYRASLRVDPSAGS
jgi:hypothetical protein